MFSYFCLQKALIEKNSYCCIPRHVIDVCFLFRSAKLLTCLLYTSIAIPMLWQIRLERSKPFVSHQEILSNSWIKDWSNSSHQELSSELLKGWSNSMNSVYYQPGSFHHQKSQKKLLAVTFITHLCLITGESLLKNYRIRRYIY